MYNPTVLFFHLISYNVHDTTLVRQKDPPITPCNNWGGGARYTTKHWLGKFGFHSPDSYILGLNLHVSDSYSLNLAFFLFQQQLIVVVPWPLLRLGIWFTLGYGLFPRKMSSVGSSRTEIQTDSWVSERASERASEWVSEWVSEYVSEWVSEWVSMWVSEWVSEWPSGGLMLYSAAAFKTSKITSGMTVLKRSFK